MMIMPDPTLAPEMQMEQVSGGSLAQKPSNNISPIAATANTTSTAKLSPGGFGTSSSPVIQRDFSMFSISGRTTADTKFRADLLGGRSMSSIMSPAIRFGMQK